MTRESDWLREQKRKDHDREREDRCEARIRESLEAIRSDFPEVFWPFAVARAIIHTDDDRLRDHYDLGSIVDLLQEAETDYVESLYARLRELGNPNPEQTIERGRLAEVIARLEAQKGV